MENQLSHFAIFTENMERAKAFYGAVFNWGFKSYGPEDFCQITAKENDKNPIGALQDRQYQLSEKEVIGLECSFRVKNVDATAKLVEQNGGNILMPKTEIPGVGWLIKFRDTEGNILCAVQYRQH